MSKIQDLLLHLAHNPVAAEHFEVAPERFLDEFGIVGKERAAILSGDAVQVLGVIKDSSPDNAWLVYVRTKVHVVGD